MLLRRFPRIASLLFLLSLPALLGASSCDPEPPVTPGKGTLTVQLSGAGFGAVTSDVGGLNCGEGGTQCSAELAAGTVVRLTATPRAGSRFVGWSGGSCTGTAPCQVQVQADKDIVLSAPFAIATLSAPLVSSIEVGQKAQGQVQGLALTYYIALQGIFPSQGGSGAQPDVMLGEVRVFAFGFAPRGWAICAGQLLPINQNQALFSLLGTQYGGDGRTTFALPDLRGAVAVGTGTLVGGAEPAPALGDSQVPFLAPTPSGLAYGASGQGAAQVLGVQTLIALSGIFPPRDGNGAAVGYIGQIRLFAGSFVPSGFAACAGQLLPIAQNTALFSLLGTQYGGDGRTTFALPDLRARAPMGSGAQAVAPPPVGDGEIPLITSVPAIGSRAGEAQLGVQGITLAVAASGIFPSPSGGGAVSSTPFVGEVLLFGGTFAPGGWYRMDGATVSIANEETLFNLLGTTFGGDGQTTFALPDTRARVIVGPGRR